MRYICNAYNETSSAFTTPLPFPSLSTSFTSFFYLRVSEVTDHAVLVDDSRASTDTLFAAHSSRSAPQSSIHYQAAPWTSIPLHVLRATHNPSMRVQSRSLASLPVTRRIGNKYFHSSSRARLRRISGQSDYRYVAAPRVVPRFVAVEKAEDPAVKFTSMDSSHSPERVLATDETGEPPMRSPSTTSKPSPQRGSAANKAKIPQAKSTPATSDPPPLPLTHLNARSEAHMVSIADKVPTTRSATAFSWLAFSEPATYSSLNAAKNRKGDAIAVARVAGIQAAKKTSDLIPLAHPSLAITGMKIDISPCKPLDTTHSVLHYLPHLDLSCGGVLIRATVECEGKTGIEMEAIVAASITALTLYDMLKGVDKAMCLSETRVIAKSGGKSGDWKYSFKRKEILRVNRQDEVIDGESASSRTENVSVRQQLSTSKDEPSRILSDEREEAILDLVQGGDHQTDQGMGPRTTKQDSNQHNVANISERDEHRSMRIRRHLTQSSHRSRTNEHNQDQDQDQDQDEDAVLSSQPTSPPSSTNPESHSTQVQQNLRQIQHEAVHGSNSSTLDTSTSHPPPPPPPSSSTPPPTNSRLYGPTDVVNTPERGSCFVTSQDMQQARLRRLAKANGE